MKQSHKSFLLILLAAFLGSAIGVFQKIALQEIGPITFTLLRFIIGACTLLPFVIRRGFPWKNPKKVLLVSLFLAGNITFFILGLEKTTVTISSMLYAAVPLIAAVFSYIFLHEKVSGKKLAGIIVGFIGVIVIILLPVAHSSNAFEGNFIGNLIILAGACSFALYTVFSKELQKDYSSTDLTMFGVITTAAVQIFLVPIDQGYQHVPLADMSTQTILAILYVGIVGTGLYYFLYQQAIKIATPIIASMILYLAPIFSFCWAAVLLGERLTFGFVIGALLAFIGVALVTKPEKAPAF